MLHHSLRLLFELGKGLMTKLEQKEVNGALLGTLSVGLIKTRHRDIRQSELSGKEDIWPDASLGSI